MPKDKNAITPLQQDMLKYIVAYIETHRRSPSIHEITVGVDRPNSQGTISIYLRILQDKQLVRLRRGFRKITAARLSLSEPWTTTCPLCFPPEGVPLEEVNKMDGIVRDVFEEGR